MKISNTVLNAMLDSQFNTSGRTYNLILFYEGGGESTPEAIEFDPAALGVVELSASKFFVIPDGTTINGLRVEDDLTEVYIIETFGTPVDYTSDGTFTVNNITVSVAVAV